MARNAFLRATMMRDLTSCPVVESLLQMKADIDYGYGLLHKILSSLFRVLVHQRSCDSKFDCQSFFDLIRTFQNLTSDFCYTLGLDCCTAALFTQERQTLRELRRRCWGKCNVYTLPQSPCLPVATRYIRESQLVISYVPQVPNISQNSTYGCRLGSGLSVRCVSAILTSS